MNKLLDGTAIQSGHARNSDDYSNERLYYPVLGIVLTVYSSDDKRNKSSVTKHDGRGSRWEAEVLVINDGSDTYWKVKDAIILSSGVTGIDDFHEELPRGCSQMLDGSVYKSNLASIDPNKLDGDRCLVSFVGGRLSQPVITNWFPHPSNTFDSSTQGLRDSTLTQGKRFAKRYSGTELVVTPKGSVFLDTNNSGSTVVGTSGGVKRKKTDVGGDVCLSVKPGRKLEVNFNPSVPTPTTEPALFQPNPSIGEFTRNVDKTTVTFDEDFVNAVAGKVVQLIGKQIQDSILLGETPTDHAVLGEHLLATFNAMISVFNANVAVFNSHKHLDSTGSPTGSPISAAIPNPGFIPFPTPGTAGPPSLDTNPMYVGTGTAQTDGSEMPESDLSEVVKLQ
jgi:hypothetical protein